MNLMNLEPILSIYFSISISFWLVTAFVSGYIGNKMTKSDFYGGLFWPLSIAELLGQLAKLVTEWTKK